MILQILILLLILLVLPVLVGSIFADVDRKNFQLPFRWVSGQLCLWAGFQLICVPMILLPKENSFFNMMLLYGVFTAAMLLFATGLWIRRRVKARAVNILHGFDRERDWIALLLWGLVLALLAVQLVLAVMLAYEEGDDAFYVAISSITAESGTMYEVLPYTGGSTGLDARHGLAPFPVWIAMLSRLSGLHSAAIAQTVLPVVLILMAYAIYYMIGRRLFGGGHRRLPLFLLFLELLVVFGGQSLYTAENFLLVRTAQGKAVLADIVIPFLFLLLLVLFEKAQQGEGTDGKDWLLLAMTMTAGCLCSTQGALLTCMLLAVAMACGAVCYRRWKLLPLTAACCVVPAGFALLYLFL